VKTLYPHSPATKLKGAKDAQWLLSGHNRFKQRTYSGKIDGLYGEGTGHAADAMRYWLGYPKWKLAGKFGPMLYSYLLPKDNHFAKALPLTYRLRRKRRLANEKKRRAKLATHGKTQALKEALSQQGYHEYGYSNSNKFGAWFGFDRVAWCAEFVSWAFRRMFGGRLRTALAYQFMYWAESGTFGLRRTFHPEPGDIVVFRHGQGHVEIFRSGTASSFESVGGNTICGGYSDNGGEVCSHHHGTEHNPYFVRVP
jgi:hypothetical protein